MTDHDAKAAWRLFNLNWSVLGCMAIALLLCFTLTRFSIQIDARLLIFSSAAALLTGMAYWLFAYTCSARLPFVLVSIAQLQLLWILAAPLTYVAAAASLPMQDATFAHWDRALGLDWPAYFNFIYDRPALIPYLYIGYSLIKLQVMCIPIALGIARQYYRLQQFTLACALALIVTTIVSTLMPGMGTFHEYGITPDPSKLDIRNYLIQLQDVPLVRDGSLRMLSITQLGGIITFPSFHAAAAILALWALWSVWWMRPFALMANASMLLATPLVGGHYFVDVFAGIGLAVLAIFAARLAGRVSNASIGVGQHHPAKATWAFPTARNAQSVAEAGTGNSAPLQY